MFLSVSSDTWDEGFQDLVDHHLLERISITIQEQRVSTARRCGSMESTSIVDLKAIDKVGHDLLPQSYFPCLDSRPGTNRAWQSVEVPYKDVARLHLSCRQNNVSPTAIFQSAWALVLRYYLGTHSVCFGCITSQKFENVEGLLTPPQRMSICKIDFVSGASIQDILETASTNGFRVLHQTWKTQASILEQPSATDTLPANTALLYQENYRRKGPGPVRITFQDCAGSVHGNVRVAIFIVPPLYRDVLLTSYLVRSTGVRWSLKE